MHTNKLLIAFILGYWLQSQTTAFLFPNMSKGSSTQEVTEFCYSDGYIPGQDVITVNGRVYPMMSEIEIPPLSVYVKSETDDSKQLVCVLDFLIPSSVSCVLEKETKKAGDPDPSKIMYKFNIIVHVAPDWNNCRLIIEHRTKDAPWDYISSVIRVHPLPLLKIKINGAQLNAHRCRFGTDVGSELLVIFCVENLQAPRLEVSWENEHGVIEENGCITRNLKHTKADEWLQFVFLDNCHNDGSISCRIVDKESNLVNIVNETVTPKMDEPTETESDTSDYSWILFMLPLLISSLFALAGLLCFALSYRASKRKESTVSDDESTIKPPPGTARSKALLQTPSKTSPNALKAMSESSLKSVRERAKRNLKVAESKEFYYAPKENIGQENGTSDPALPCHINTFFS